MEKISFILSIVKHISLRRTLRKHTPLALIFFSLMFLFGIFVMPKVFITLNAWMNDCPVKYMKENDFDRFRTIGTIFGLIIFFFSFPVIYVDPED